MPIQTINPWDTVNQSRAGVMGGVRQSLSDLAQMRLEKERTEKLVAIEAQKIKQQQMQEERLAEAGNFKLIDDLLTSGNKELAQSIYDAKYKSKYGEKILNTKEEYNSAEDKKLGNVWGWPKGNPFDRRLIQGKTDPITGTQIPRTNADVQAEEIEMAKKKKEVELSVEEPYKKAAAEREEKSKIKLEQEKSKLKKEEIKLKEGLGENNQKDFKNVDDLKAAIAGEVYKTGNLSANGEKALKVLAGKDSEAAENLKMAFQMVKGDLFNMADKDEKKKQLDEAISLIKDFKGKQSGKSKITTGGNEYELEETEEE